MLGLANAWQRDFPLTSRPFHSIGERAGLPERAVLEKFAELKGEGLIDRIGPVFRPNSVGASSLAAMAVPPERLDEVAAFVSGQPGVNHNYEREHRYNLWFVATGPTHVGVEWVLAGIEDYTGIPVLRLPLVEEFHIDLGFDLETRQAPRSVPAGSPPPLSAREKDLVRAIAAGLPLVPRPYQALANDVGVREEQVIAILRGMLADGRIRRIGAVIRHRRIGYQANAMAVWDVPDDRVGAIGAALARDPAVTLCYRRARALPDWPYNLYCMVHGKERAWVLDSIRGLQAVQDFPGAVLFSRRCFTQRAASYG